MHIIDKTCILSYKWFSDMLLALAEIREDGRLFVRDRLGTGLLRSAMIG
jgi:hypothetical protein